MGIYATLHEYWNVGIAVAIGCASVLLSRDALMREFMRGIVPAITVVAVLATTLLAFVMYLSITEEELALAKHYKYVEKTGPLHAQHFALVFLLALCFGGLIAFVTNPLIYTIIITVLQLADSAATYVVQSKIFHAYEESKRTLSQAIPRPIYDYYLVRPHFILRTARLLGYIAALIVAIIAQFRPTAMLTELVWVIVLVTTVTCELVIRSWRQQRRTLTDGIKGIGAAAA